jgi:hypothetical protein
MLPSGAVVTASPSQATTTGQVAQPAAGTPLQPSNHATPVTPENPRPDSIASQAPSFQSVIHPSSSFAQRSQSIPEGSPYLAQPSAPLASQDAVFLKSIQRSPSIKQRSPSLAPASDSPIELTRTLSAAQRSALRISLGSPLPGDIARTAPQLPNVIQRRSSLPVEPLLTESSRRSVSLQYYTEIEAEDRLQSQGQSPWQVQAVTEDQQQTLSRPSSIQYEGPGPREGTRASSIYYEGLGPIGSTRPRPSSIQYEGPGPLGGTQHRPSSIQYEGPGPLGSTRPRPSPIQYEGPGPLGSAAAATRSNPDGTTINTSPHPVPTAEQLAIEAEIAERLHAIAGILGNIDSSRSRLRTGLGSTYQDQRASKRPTTAAPAAATAAPTSAATPARLATTVDIQNLERRLDLFASFYQEVRLNHASSPSPSQYN